MNADDFRDFLHRRPFEPFRIRVSSGDAYEVRNADLVAIMKTRLFIAFPGEDRYTLCPYLHIAAVESLQAA